MIRVLLIDDEEDALDLLEILLGQIGGVTVVGRYVNPLEALQALDALGRSQVDAVFLDNQMPGMSGTEAARVIREMQPHVHVVFTTAYAEYAVEAFEIQSTDYLLKPLMKERLQNAVARIRKSLTKAAEQERLNTSSSPGIQCLGGFHIQISGNGNGLLSWKTKKERELCALLIHHGGRPVNTASIIEALWSGHDLHKAKTYLYTCLSYLRKSLSENNIPITIHTTDQGFVALLNGVDVDVTQFESLLSRPLSAEGTNESGYDAMNRLYKGDYMEACDFDWAAARQMGLKMAYVRALRRWGGYYRSQGNAALVIDSIQRILAVVPDSEMDGRELIRLHLEAGNRNEALRVCLQLEQAVRLQLGAELEEETLRLLQTVNPKERQARGER